MLLLEPALIEADQLHTQDHIADDVVEAGQRIATLHGHFAGFNLLDIFFFVIRVLVEPIATGDGPVLSLQAPASKAAAATATNARRI